MIGSARAAAPHGPDRPARAARSQIPDVSQAHYRPETNGKAERFIKTLLAEWAYWKRYRANHERLHALPRWVDFYNHRRPHTALDGEVPMDVLVNNVRGNHI
ncbi:hypothetical protein BH20CHL6_BH20CHL6_03920 [soil metagenome]